MVLVWLMFARTAANIATLYLALKSGAPLADAQRGAYTKFDGAMLGSIISYWFPDRGLRKVGKWPWSRQLHRPQHAAWPPASRCF